MISVWENGAMTTAPRYCSAPDCDRQIGARARTGLCVPHQARLRRTGSLGTAAVRAYGVTAGTATTKTCTGCKQEKPLTDFFRRARSSDGYRPLCKPCADAKASSWRANNPERAAANLRFASMRRKYGLTREQYSTLVATQDGRCAVCSENLPASPCVDHDHTCCPGDRTCGQCIRGLLCRPCNVLLGMARDNPDTLRAAVRYLENRPPIKGTQP